MGVNHIFTRRPGEDRKAPILRCHEGDRVMLIVNELCRRKVPGAAELDRMDNRRRAAHNWLGDYDLLDLRGTVATLDLSSKCQQLILVADDCSAVDRSQATDGFNRVAERL